MRGRIKQIKTVNMASNSDAYIRYALLSVVQQQLGQSYCRGLKNS